MEVDDDRLKAARKAKQELGGLLKHPGWSMLEGLVKAQVDRRIEVVIFTPTTQDRVLEQEYMKGEIAGLKLVTALIHTEYEQAVAMVEHLDE